MASKILHVALIFIAICTATSTYANNQIERGFSTKPNPSSSNFQTILTDPTSTFSLVFLPVEKTQLDLAIIHLPSSFPLWRATPYRLASWSASTTLTFNGTLTLSDPKTGAFWSTKNDIVGDDIKLVLLNSSNLQIVKNENPVIKILWQSFELPSDTIVQSQNFTSESSLSSTNQKFSMRLGSNFLGLYLENIGVERPPILYWKRTALQAKAQIVQGNGPIYARVDPTGFLGIYQNEEKAPADVMSFDTFNGGVKLDLRRLTLENDGNLRAYYWNGSGWVSDFVAISETCDLPNPCGAYGLCHVDGQICGGCLDGRMDGGCFAADSGDLCGSGFRVLRRAGVDLVNDELIGFVKVGSLDECEGLCEKSCKCWGAVYNNVSGYCYRVEYPIQTILAAGDAKKFGYFKVKNEERSSEISRRRAGLVLLVVGALVLAGGCGYAGYRVWNARRWRRSEEDEVVMPYKDLNSSSFRSIEMSKSFRK